MSHHNDLVEFERQTRIARQIMEEDRAALLYLAGHQDAVPKAEVEKARENLRAFHEGRKASGVAATQQ